MENLCVHLISADSVWALFWEGKGVNLFLVRQTTCTAMFWILLANACFDPGASNSWKISMQDILCGVCSWGNYGGHSASHCYPIRACPLLWVRTVAATTLWWCWKAVYIHWWGILLNRWHSLSSLASSVSFSGRNVLVLEEEGERER